MEKKIGSETPNLTEFDDLVKIFSYNKDLPLDIKENKLKQEENISTFDISYNGAKKRINAYLVKSSKEKPSSGIIFVHPAPGDRSTFLNEALKLAQKDVTSLLIDAPWANPPEFIKIELNGIENPEEYRQFLIQTVVDLRRALDLMNSLDYVDNNRIGFVGHSFGALFGGILSGVEERIKTYILMAGAGSFTDVALLNVPDLKGEKLNQFRETMYPIDPVNYVSHAAHSSLFYQFGTQDTSFSREAVIDFYEAGSKPKYVQWYEADHYLNEKAHLDREKWLSDKLELK
jgi:pimeloyl-ACP methyl ester carboxylesterase